MNRSLLARTRRSFYADWAIVARRGGLSEDVVDASIAKEIREAKSLLEGKCPVCGAPSARYVDYTRQQGVSDMPGMWVMYRCSTAPPPGKLRPDDVCDFMLDLKEGEAAN